MSIKIDQVKFHDDQSNMHDVLDWSRSKTERRKTFYSLKKVEKKRLGLEDSKKIRAL